MGSKNIIGIDEVGRGAWAGPLVVGAVMLSVPIAGLTDSKKLDKKRRTFLAKEITASALFVSLGWVSAREVDELGLTKATVLACERAIEKAPKATEIIIDGLINYLPHMTECSVLVKADLHIPAVSAASIVAKVARDTYMTKQAMLYPEYGFDTHVGYGTKKHLSALETFGVTPLHRRSYKPLMSYIS